MSTGGVYRLAFPPRDHEIYLQEIIEVKGNPCGYPQDLTIQLTLRL